VAIGRCGGGTLATAGDDARTATDAGAAIGAGTEVVAPTDTGVPSQQPSWASRGPVGGAQHSWPEAFEEGCGAHGQLGTAAARATTASTAALDRNVRNMRLNGTMGAWRRSSLAAHSSTRRSRSAFVITVTELRLMAAAAIIGESSQPSQG
jgi:hypothetical protein